MTIPPNPVSRSGDVDPNTPRNGAAGGPSIRVQSDDTALIAQLDQSRQQLVQAADVLRSPLRSMARAEHAARSVLPMLPYAFAALAVVGLARSVFGRGKLRPMLMIATGLDIWRLWRSYQVTAAMPTTATSTPRIDTPVPTFRGNPT